jgi:hypothetical protein
MVLRKVDNLHHPSYSAITNKTMTKAMVTPEWKNEQKKNLVITTAPPPYCKVLPLPLKK